MKRIFTLLCAFWALSASAKAEDFAYGSLAQMPVLQDGRLKPLDSLARVMAARICAVDNCGFDSASQWLAFVFFAPAKAAQAPFFSVKTGQAVSMLSLPASAGNRYNLESLSTAFSRHAEFMAQLARKPKNLLSADEAELLRLYGATGDFIELLGTFSLVLPLENITPAQHAMLGLPSDQPITQLDLHRSEARLSEDFKTLVARKGGKADAYDANERQLAMLASRLLLQQALDKDNALVRIVPPAWGREEWLTPWLVLKTSQGSPATAALLRKWRDAALAYRNEDSRSWNRLTRQILDHSLSTLSAGEAWRLSLEYSYHRLNLLFFAGAGYGLGLLSMGMCLRRRSRFWQSAGYILLAGAVSMHATALLMRMLILNRPPVSTLYESLIFVSFIVMLASCWLGLRKGHMSALFAGGFTALLLLLASSVFAGDSDTLGVLVAVLNTNFWLATHVVCITTGYGSALVTGAVAHLYLLRRAAMGQTEASLAGLYRLVHRLALVALLFTATGTMLGGIWADQSWGRFWGWDPKENGALLIVLWLIWLLHGRIAGQLKAFAFCALMALINIVVGLAWIGVNLLSVGLHSYGFTDSAALGLGCFTALELTYVGCMTGLYYWRSVFQVLSISSPLAGED